MDKAAVAGSAAVIAFLQALRCASAHAMGNRRTFFDTRPSKCAKPMIRRKSEGYTVSGKAGRFTDGDGASLQNFLPPLRVTRKVTLAP